MQKQQQQQQALQAVLATLTEIKCSEGGKFCLLATVSLRLEVTFLLIK